jgi:hypothetical protein
VFGEGGYVDPEAVADAVRRRTLFNVIGYAGGKFDLIPLRHDDLFEREKMERRTLQDWHGMPVGVIAAADLVLSKLEWAREHHSARQSRTFAA